MYGYEVKLMQTSFEWDENKNEVNQRKHGVSFYDAQYAFTDPQRIIAEDSEHSHLERRYYCFGKIEDNVMTVRFTYRGNMIRIIGAGYWRGGKKIYEKAQKDKIHK